MISSYEHLNEKKSINNIEQQQQQTLMVKTNKKQKKIHTTLHYVFHM